MGASTRGNQLGTGRRPSASSRWGPPWPGAKRTYQGSVRAP